MSIEQINPPTLRRIDQLVEAGLIPASAQAELAGVVERYALALTPALAALINTSDPQDPIARQFVPQADELTTTPDENADPIGDFRFTPVKGIVHRYPDRVLLKPVHVCPVYCRFCFRREMVGPGGDSLTDTEMDAAIGYVQDHPEIFEVILTGGDPLMLAPRRLRDLIDRLSSIPHLQAIRIHTRVPIADPARINVELLNALESPVALWVSVHCNHVQELGPEQRAALTRLSKAGIPLLSQTVLLREVNNSVSALTDLFRALFSLRVKPYHLHHPDLAPGTKNFRLSIEEGQQLVAALWKSLPGPARPVYVLDIPGGFGKTPLSPSAIEPAGNSQYWVRGLDGKAMLYPPLTQ